MVVKGKGAIVMVTEDDLIVVVGTQLKKRTDRPLPLHLILAKRPEAIGDWAFKERELVGAWTDSGA